MSKNWEVTIKYVRWDRSLKGHSLISCSERFGIIATERDAQQAGLDRVPLDADAIKITVREIR